MVAPPLEPSEAVEEPALRKHLNRILEAEMTLAPALLAYAQELPPGGRRRRLTRSQKIGVAGVATAGNDVTAANSRARLRLRG